MWLSKMLSKENSNQTAESGTITLSNNQSWEASATVNARNLSSFSPFGYSFSAPVGEEVILVPSSDGQVALGTKMDSSQLENGEIKIVANSGACIYLKSDGSVEINGLVISPEGVINN
jgi:hypothetical protein